MRTNHLYDFVRLTALLILPLLPLAVAEGGSSGESFKVKVVSNLIVMPGFVNDSPRMNVALDSGASTSVLLPERAAELNLKLSRSLTAPLRRRGEPL